MALIPLIIEGSVKAGSARNSLAAEGVDKIDIPRPAANVVDVKMHIGSVRFSWEMQSGGYDQGFEIGAAVKDIVEWFDSRAK